MNLLDRIKTRFSPETEEVKIQWDQAEKLFKDRKKAEIELARERSQELISSTGKIVQNLEENLEELKDYKDREELDVVEDVAESFYQSRKRQVENFNPSEDIEEHQKNLREFLNEFNDVSRKQGAVMQRVEQDSGKLSSSLDRFLEHTEEVENFLESKYGTIRNLEHISNIEENIRNLEKKIEELENELENEETGSLESEIAETENEIEELKQSEEYREKKKLQEKLEQKKAEKKEIQKDLSGQVSGLERGLKKLTYNVRNNGESFENSLEKLENLREEKFSKIENPEPELKEALQIVQDEGLIDGRQLDKFKNSVKKLSSYDERTEEIEELQEEIEKVKEKLSKLEIEEQLNELKKRKNHLENSLDEKHESIENQKDRIKEIREEIASKHRKLEKALNDYLNAEVEVKQAE